MHSSRILDPSSPYLTDESKMTGNASTLHIPESESQIMEIMEDASRRGVCMTISAMRTGVCGGAVPIDSDVMTLEKMNKILGIGEDERGFYIRVQPAVTVNQLNDLIRKRSYEGLLEISEGAISAAKNASLFYPVDPTELNSSIGGNISTNASGPRTYKYGPTRNWIKRIRVVLSTGKVLDIERGRTRAVEGVLELADGIKIKVPTYDFRYGIKNATGIMTAKDVDAIDIFIGSEGIFGIISEADVYLAPWHPLMSNILFFPDDQNAYDFVKEIVNSDVDPEFLEFFDTGSLNLIRRSRMKDPRFTGMPDLPEKAGSAVFFDLPYDQQIQTIYQKIENIAIRHSGSLKFSWCGHELKDRQRFFSFRHSVPQSIFEYVATLKGGNPGIHKMGTDMSVPLEKLDEMMDNYRSTLSRYDLEYVIFGHIGNGHLHVEIILKDMDDVSRAKKAYRELAIKAIELGGSPSAEHGIGKLKTEYIQLMYGEKGTDEIKGIKDALDPEWILNPGNMVVR